MALWNPAAYLDPLGFALGQGLAGGAQNFARGVALDRDQQALQNWMTTPVQGPVDAMGQGPVSPMPTFLSPQYRQMALGLQAQQMQNLLPMSPLDRARLGLIQSQTGYYDAQSLAQLRGPAMAGPVRIAEEGDGSGLEPGTRYYLDRYRAPHVLSTPTEERKAATEAETAEVQLKILQDDELAKLPPEDRLQVKRYEAKVAKLNALRADWEQEDRPIAKKMKGEQLKKLELEVKGAQGIQNQIDAIESQMKRLDDSGLKNTDQYNALQARWDQLQKVRKGGTDVTIKQMTEGMIQRQANRSALVDLANDVLQTWQPEYTGPIEGRLLAFRNRWLGGTEGSAKFEASVTALMEQMYMRAGKQLSDREIAVWRPFLPSITNPDEVFTGRVRNLIDNVATYLEHEQRLATEAGYKIPDPSTGASPLRVIKGETYMQDFEGKWWVVPKPR